MAVKFISHVDENKNGEWFIKLTDTLEESSVICNNLDEYKEKIEELGGEYGNEIEVVWTKSRTLSPHNYQDLNNKMEKLQKEYEAEIEQINQQSQSMDNNGGFNPNA